LKLDMSIKYECPILDTFATIEFEQPN